MLMALHFHYATLLIALLRHFRAMPCHATTCRRYYTHIYATSTLCLLRHTCRLLMMARREDGMAIWREEAGMNEYSAPYAVQLAIAIVACCLFFRRHFRR